ncbi:DNRLRE domain-containing protein, partial [Sphaerimonospora cavernae]
PTTPVEIRIGVQSKGLALSESADGRLLLKNRKNAKLVASAPQPVMWAAPPAAGGGQDATGRPGKISTEVAADNDGGQVLVLRPDAEFLADPATAYPVTIDPTVTLPLTTDTTVVQGSTRSYDGDTTISAGAYTTSLSRAFVKFDTAALAGATVQGATLKAYQKSISKPSTCPRAGIRASRVTAGWDPATITWSNQPAYTTAGETITLESNGCAAKTYMSWTITSIVQAWASGTPNYGLQLRGNVETTSAGYQVFFDSSEAGTGRAPSLSVTYTINSTPAVGNLSISPLAGTDVSSLTPTLHAAVSDPAGGSLRADYEIEHDPAHPGQGSGQIWAGSSAAVTPGSDAVAAVPAGKLADGWHIRWRARATNTGTSVSSAWSDWQTATITVPDPVVDQLQVTPSQDVSGETVTSSLTPALAARVITPDAAASRVEFELEHDPAAPQGQGTGQIWTAGADDVASGAQATVTVPDGTLADGWKVRWRARAIAPGSNASAWSEWQPLTVKVPAATVSQLQVTPSQTDGQTTTITSLTPHLLATVTDAYGAALRAEFEIEHDPADTQHGTGQIWAGAVDDVASGTQASVEVPGGKLANGWGVRWRARAVNPATQVASAWSDWQTGTVNAGDLPSEPGVTALQVTPAQVVDGTTVTSSLTPRLLAQVTDPAGGTLRAEFELEHDPAAPAGQGSGQIWAGAADNVPAGTQASVTVPEQTLSEGWLVRWRARAVAGDTASAWSDWQNFRVDRPDPVLGTLQVVPSQEVDGTTVASSLTPQLLAQVTDPAGGKVRAEFELEHDPADTEHGTGSIWTGAVDDVDSGAQATVTVPDGKLSDGWKVRWRARALTPGGT